VADCGTQLWTIDTRKTSGPLCAYKGMRDLSSEAKSELRPGLSGKVTSISVSPSTGSSAAGSLDRYFRLLGQGGPPGGSGGVIGKLYVTSAPAAIVPIEVSHRAKASDEGKGDIQSDEGDKDWDGIQQVSSDEEDVSQARKKRKKRE